MIASVAHFEIFAEPPDLPISTGICLAGRSKKLQAVLSHPNRALGRKSYPRRAHPTAPFRGRAVGCTTAWSAGYARAGTGTGL